MKRPRVLILRTAGTNCDEETFHAWHLAGADPQRVHVRELMAHPGLLDDYAILTIPGGFSYGDDISAGRILANQIVHHLAEAIAGFVAAGRLVLGICNGFQVLVKAGLLPGGLDEPIGPQVVTLTANDSARFEDRWVHLRTSRTPNAFLPPDRILAMPIAHAEGKVVALNAATLQRIADRGQMAVTYCDERGEPGLYPINPNGSEGDVAGLTDATGRIFGLMPHPERHIYRTQHPEWTGRDDELADGRVVFETAVRTAADL
jgi:phosphoribosylformylglycinamidine synthase